jgi:hypothetical protein
MADAAIQYLRKHEIDISRWNRCIEEAGNGLIYAYAFYLDAMATDWDALVLGDYEAVMPLPWRKKWGTHYLYQPAFTASLGIFGKAVTPALVAAFIDAIPARFKLIEINCNHGNVLPAAAHVVVRNNYTVNLQKSYEALYQAYRENIRRNIKKSQQLQLRYATGIPVEEVIRLSQNQLQHLTNLTPADYKHFGELCQYLLQEGKALTSGVYTPAGELVASCVYFFSHHRAYYILVGNHPNGKTLGASHYLIDRFIYDHAGRNLLLDFEGSDIRNLAFFYSSFGASLETYPALRINRLPWWVRWMK